MFSLHGAVADRYAVWTLSLCPDAGTWRPQREVSGSCKWSHTQTEAQHSLICFQQKLGGLIYNEVAHRHGLPSDHWAQPLFMQWQQCGLIRCDTFMFGRGWEKHHSCLNGLVFHFLNLCYVMLNLCRMQRFLLMLIWDLPSWTPLPVCSVIFNRHCQIANMC